MKLALASIALLTACFPEPGDGAITHMWISSDKDSYVSCGNPMQACPEKNNTYNKSNQLVAAEWDLGIKKSYIHFTPPTLPLGAEILEARVEVFHSGKNEDGRSDDLLLPVDRALAPWSPATLTYANQPNKELNGSFTQLDLVSQDWSSTGNMADVVRGWIDNPASNNGIVLYWFSTSQNAEKGFWSNNHSSRTATELGLAPRLLMRVRFADGTSTDDMVLGALPADNDLELGREVLMVRYVTSGNWPAAWKVRQ